MTIETKAKDEIKRIGDIETGECFAYEGEIYMKTNASGGNKTVECVILESGDLFPLGTENYAIPVRAKVVIE